MENVLHKVLLVETWMETQQNPPFDTIVFCHNHIL
jgi:hypothetical protein